MNQVPSTPHMEIQPDPTELESLGAVCPESPSSLSPLAVPATGTAPNKLNSDLFDTDGRLLPNLQPASNILSHPRIAAAISAIGDDMVLDWAVYHGSNGQTVALSHAGKSLWLQQPPPIAAIVEKLRQSLLPDGGKQQIAWRLTRVEAAVVWSVIDLLHLSEKEERFSVSGLAAVLDMPLQGITWLAAFFRDSSQMPLPTKDALLSACNSLVEKGLLGKMGEEFLAGKEMKELARQITDIHWYARLRLSSEIATGEVVTFEEFLAQWDSGQCLAWYEVDETVIILSKQPPQLLEMVTSALIQPEGYFINPQSQDPAAKPGQVPQQGPVPIPRKKPKWPWIVAGVVALLLICCVAALLIGTLSGYIQWR